MKVNKSYLDKADRDLLIALKTEIGALIKLKTPEAKTRILEIKQLLADMKTKKREMVEKQ